MAFGYIPLTILIICEKNHILDNQQIMTWMRNQVKNSPDHSVPPETIWSKLHQNSTSNTQNHKTACLLLWVFSYTVYTKTVIICVWTCICSEKMDCEKRSRWRDKWTPLVNPLPLHGYLTRHLCPFLLYPCPDHCQQCIANNGQGLQPLKKVSRKMVVQWLFTTC